MAEGLLEYYEWEIEALKKQIKTLKEDLHHSGLMNQKIGYVNRAYRNGWSKDEIDRLVNGIDELESAKECEIAFEHHSNCRRDRQEEPSLWPKREK